MRVRRYCLFLLLLGAGVFPSCSSQVKVKSHRLPVAGARMVQRLINPDKLVPETKAVLQEEELLRVYKRHPELAVEGLHQRLKLEPSAKIRLALIEICSDTGEWLLGKDTNLATGYHLAAAEFALQGLVQEEKVNSAEEKLQLQEIYNYSCSRVARILFDASSDWIKPLSFRGPEKTYQLSFRTKGEGLLSLSEFDRLWAAENLSFDDSKILQRNVRKGFGGALVVHRDWSEERVKKEPLLAKVGMALPVTAILSPIGKGGEVELSIHDVMIQDAAELLGKEVSLSADFTAPLAILKNHMHWEDAGLNGLFHPQRNMENLNLFKLEPFREDQIPIIFVHGLMSSPETWAKMVNTFRADPELRKTYQPLLFFYPTGFPISYNADQLRTFLKELRENLDPNGKNPRMKDMIIIGHSMGGNLSDAQIRSNDGDMGAWGGALSEIGKKEKLLREALSTYQANPDITRAVFIATPHRGSDLANKSLVGGVVSLLIRFPSVILIENKLTQSLLFLGSSLSGMDLNVNSKQFNSIESLKPGSPDLLAILDQRVRSGVVYHSIIAQADPSVPLEDSSDEVVKYESSHLSGASSEKVVHAKHLTINRNDMAIEEVRRILYLHAGLSYRPKVFAEEETEEPSLLPRRNKMKHPSRRRP